MMKLNKIILFPFKFAVLLILEFLLLFTYLFGIFKFCINALWEQHCQNYLHRDVIDGLENIKYLPMVHLLWRIYTKRYLDATSVWFDENLDLGTELGYPDCCVYQFILDAPEIIKHRKVTDDDIARLEASKINGELSGFIPCADHAHQILKGERTIESLIENRNPVFLPFPEQ